MIPDEALGFLSVVFKDAHSDGDRGIAVSVRGWRRQSFNAYPAGRLAGRKARTRAPDLSTSLNERPVTRGRRRRMAASRWRSLIAATAIYR
jgi:hypothetical protein